MRSSCLRRAWVRTACAQVIDEAKRAGATYQQRGSRPPRAHVRCPASRVNRNTVLCRVLTASSRSTTLYMPPQVCVLQGGARGARWAQHKVHDWYECGGGEGAEPTCGEGFWRWWRGRGDCRGSLDAPQPLAPQPLAPRPPTADIVIALARARHGRFVVAVTRPDRREWKLFSWPRSSVNERLRDELTRHEGQWAQLGAQDAVLVAAAQEPANSGW